jgi:2-(3-amino-3-carboxypropyl)histidine synthase
MAEACLLKERLVESGREAFIIEMDFIAESKVESMGLDAIIVCACPRIAIDDILLWKRPVLTPPELDIMLGGREEYIVDEIG